VCLLAGFTSPPSGGSVNNAVGLYTSRNSTSQVWPPSPQFTTDPGLPSFCCVVLLFGHMTPMLGLCVLNNGSANLYLRDNFVGINIFNYN